MDSNNTELKNIEVENPKEKNAKLKEAAAKIKRNNRLKFTITIWAICIILAAICIAAYVTSYEKYKAGQDFAINAASEAGIKAVSTDKTRKENCEELYGYLTAKYYDLTIKDTTYDFSELRATMSKFKDAFAQLMYEEGHKKYDAYDIEGWFKYTNPVSYFFGEFAGSVLYIIFYILFIFTIIWTAIVHNINKRIEYEERIKELMIKEELIVDSEEE